jgi:hypothetical protein
MEEKELLEIEAREEKQTIKNLAEMIRTNRIRDIQLLYKDKFDFSGQKVCAQPLPGEVDPRLLIPLYDKTLLTIPPFGSPKVFRAQIGCNVDDILEWRKKGWIETELTAYPRCYAGLDYLDELIEVSPSSSLRTQEYIIMEVGSSIDFNRLLLEGEVAFKGVKPPEGFQSLYGDQRGVEAFYGSAASSYMLTKVWGLTSILGKVKELIRSDTDLASSLLYATSFLLISPFLSSLRQTSVYSSETKNVAMSLYEHSKQKEEAFFIPCWLVDVYDRLETKIPETMDTDEVGAVRKHSGDFVQAVKSMDEVVDKAVREKFKGGGLDKSEEGEINAKRLEFNERWRKDVRPAFEDIPKAERWWSVGLTGTIVGSALALGALVNVVSVPPALIAALAGAKNIKKLVDPAAEFLSTFFECNPIHLGFYKVHRELKKVKDKAGRQSK